MSIKAIILDIDGTLTNSQKRITEKTKQALLKVQSKGVRLILASGRPVNGLRRFERELMLDSHHGLLVASNGAEVIDCQSNQSLYNKSIPVDIGKQVLHHLKGFDVSILIAKGEYMYTNDVYKSNIDYKGKDFNVMQYESRGNGFKLCEIEDLEQWCNFEMDKILTFATPKYLQDNYHLMAEPFKNTLNSMFTADFYYEYTAKGIDKRAAIEATLMKLGYHRDEIMAFGDAPNDLSIIQMAGIGVAMGNATEAVKQQADEVTLSNDEDGIAESLYKHLSDLLND